MVMTDALFRLLNYFFPLLFLFNGPILPWVVYYGDQAPPDTFQSYNPIILDSAHHPALKSLLEDKKTVLGYLDLAEAEERLDWFAQIKEMGILINENPEFPGSWSIDIRNKLWSDFLLNKIIPDIFAEGFSGLFLDQVDVALALESQDPQKYKGMKEAAVNLIKAIRKKYPQKYLMLNRAYQILDQVGDEIDFELAETLYTSYNFKTKEYYVRPKEEFEWQLSQLNHARFLFPKLTVFSLDYWDPKDQEMYRKIYSIERAQGMRPYVSTPTLDKIYPEPKG